jgi:hypothetical protein
LLADVLAETEPARFREDLLGETLRLVGRRRRVRLFGRISAAFAVVAMLGTLAWRALLPGGTAATSSSSFTLVQTAHLPGSAIVATHAFSGDRVRTSSVNVALVRTAPGGHLLRTIDDDTLLSLVAPRPAALVRLGPGSARLIFVKPDGAASSDVN